MFILIINQLYIVSTFKCNIYPHSPIECINSTRGEKCKYDYQENRCIDLKQENLGCLENLNQEACINQLTNIIGEQVQCAFLDRCQAINNDLLQKMGCSKRLNKLACMNVKQEKCVWDKMCKNVDEDLIRNFHSDILNMPVNPYTCQSIQQGLYLSQGLQEEFRCIQMRQDQLSTYQCSQLGLNENGCIAITNQDQLCVFQNNRCQNIRTEEITSCNQKLNKNACLSVKSQNSLKLLCEWKDQCRNLQQENLQCLQQNQVSESVCQQSSVYCLYNEEQKKCSIVKQTQIKYLKCNTAGLSRSACLKIKTEKCSFHYGFCQELNDSDLNKYQCHMELNQLACLNLRTTFQYCQWDGKSCKRILMNQDRECSLSLVNGNVCQAISKPNVKCKYDQNKNICVQSKQNDECNTPFINQFGCISIESIDQTCHWSAKGCELIKVQIYQTKCENLQNVNAVTCSQVLENYDIGCYYDEIKQKCKSLDLSELDEQKTRYLNFISCKNTSLGLNKIMCSQITTQSTPCRWYQNKCHFIDEGSMESIPCLDLQFSNYQACALATFYNEPCRYLKNIRGCVNNIFIKSDSINNTNSENNFNLCDILGLNYFGCKQINQEIQINNNNLINQTSLCQFHQGKCFQQQNIDKGIDLINTIQDEQQNSENPYYSSTGKCTANSLTKIQCVNIFTKNELCIWSFSLNSCTNTQVQYNQRCQEFIEIQTYINPNVCASILTDNPEYCSYDYNTQKCKFHYQKCTSNCCTEKENIGMNAYTCGRFSNQESGVYCYFHELICQELTADKMDISNKDLVKQYYNEINLPCTSMNKNSCHMIDWSPVEKCIHDGNVCRRINYSLIGDLKVLTQSPIILNKFACYGIQTKANSQLKYFIYDEVNKRCKIAVFKSFTPFERCEEVEGNKNICTKYTGNNYCIWDPDELKCVRITKESLLEFQSCDDNLNVKSCLEGVNKQLGCFYSYQSDSCEVPPKNVDCSYFDLIGKITQAVCKTVESKGQLCEYSAELQKCVESQTQFSNCDVSSTNANMRVCFKNTKGNCRWDPINLECYENFADINTLSCKDYLNQELCIQVVQEACFWNDKDYECQQFKSMSEDQIKLFDQKLKYLFNEKACLQISKAGYYFEQSLKQCLRLDEKINTLKCDQYQMNQYACLYQTRTYQCFYDINEQPPNKLCKFFNEQQSLCQSQHLINIEVCMKLPVPCKFNESTLRCESSIDKSSKKLKDRTCSELVYDSKNKYHYNKISCAYVSSTLTQVNEGQKCSQDKNNQKCLFERYCYWSNYSCQIYQLMIDYEESDKQLQKKTCENFEEIVCPEEYTTSNYLKEDPIFTIENNWESVDETCWLYKIQHISEQKYTSKQDSSQQCIARSCFEYQETFCQPVAENIVEIYQEYNDEDLKNVGNYVKIQLADNVLQTCPNSLGQVAADNCILQDHFIYTNQWLLKYNYVKECDSSYSMALCLELNQRQCVFNLDLGGCNQLQNNEHIIPNCYSISNKCNVSNSIYAKCQKDQIIKQPSKDYKIFSQDQQTCKEFKMQKTSYNCDEIILEAQPILCAQAQDKCRFENDKCISTITKKDDICSPECNKSFSKTLCEFCDCNYQYLGYCQQSKQAPQFNDDCSNQYYLCQEVQLLQTTFKQHVCGSVDQACKYNSKCEDATHSICQDLLGLTVSKQACVRCKGSTCIYDDKQLNCNVIDVTTYDSCDNLNQQACLQSESISCKWDKFQNNKNKCTQKRDEYSCQQIDTIKGKLDCQILNQKACNQPQENLCWFNQDTQLCQVFNPYQGQCDSLKNEKLCDLSMFESCIWIFDTNKNTNICVKQSDMCSKLEQDNCEFQNAICEWNPEEQFCAEQCSKYNQSQCQKQKQDCVWKFNDKICKQKCSKLNQQVCQSQNEDCVWNYIDQKCKQKCLGLNKYGCLNQIEVACIWLDSKCEEAQFKSIKSSPKCDDFLDVSVQQLSVTLVNAQTCSSNQSTESCIFENTFKCRKISESKLYECTTLGLNKAACVQNTKGFCSFQNNKCIEIQKDEDSLGCQNYLNKQACLNQNQQCQFNKKCENFTDYVSSTGSQTPISQLVCEYSGDNIGLIYSTVQNICLNRSDYRQKLTSCDQKGINKYTCLNHVEEFCEYKEQKCQQIENLSQINSCQDNLNQFACISTQKCKFTDKCKSITYIDNCQTLSQEISENLGVKPKVNPKVCQKFQNESCYFDSKSKSCLQITNSNQQQCYGLNKKACIHNTENLICQFNQYENKCEVAFGGYQLCSDFINKNKCLSITKKGQICKFDSNGCSPSKDLLDQIQSCLDNQEKRQNVECKFQTNPHTCSQIKNIPCFYDRNQKQCIKYVDISNSPSLSILKNYHLSNILSFNKEACEQFNFASDLHDSQIPFKKVYLYWNGGCVQVQNYQLYSLKCDQNLNLNTCINIKTSQQYCQYQNNKCISVDLQNQSSVKNNNSIQCENLTQINSGAFCAKATDVACKFNQESYKCQELLETEKIDCLSKDPESKGYNQKACAQDKLNCVFKNQQCFKKQAYQQFCEDVDTNSSQQCIDVKLEACQYKNQKCASFEESDYITLNCEQAINLNGCIKIKTKGQYCYFKDQKCHKGKLDDFKSQKCEDIKNINHYIFCEQPQDIGCIFDINSNSCTPVKEEQDQICQRGINKIACLKQNRKNNKDFKCSFFDYCYNSEYVKQLCENNSDEKKCCTILIDKPSCLNQSLYKCKWQEDIGCTQYISNFQSNCEEIIDSSSIVCTSIQNQFCIYDYNNSRCKVVQDEMKNQYHLLQSPDQCIRITTMASIWDEEQQSCIYIENQDTMDLSTIYLNCEDVTTKFGNQRACMNIVKQGQLCIFKDQKCKSFEQNENGNNCMDNININSCLQQTISDCYWKSEIVKVFKKLNEQESEVLYGRCVEFKEFNQFMCNKNLSYTSCLKIKKENQFCIWENEQCQFIQIDQQSIYDTNSLIQVNYNACGLINNGEILSYNYNFKMCEVIRNIDELSCKQENTINQIGCLSIKNQDCFWDQQNKKCKLREISLTQDSCRMLNYSQQLCQQISLQMPCGFVGDGCDNIDIDIVNCDYQGLNKYACLHIIRQPCIWIKYDNQEVYHCETYIPNTKCIQVPPNVNSKVCQLIYEDPCYYNDIEHICEIPSQSQDCNSIGLNIKGCVQIENCFFLEGCQKLNISKYKCEDFPIANKQICKNASDSCKYNEITQGCSKAYDELCSNDSLSSIACIQSEGCNLTENICQCKYQLFIDDCNSFTQQDQCIQQKHCHYQKQSDLNSNENQKNECRSKTCQDLMTDECNGQIIRDIKCYINQENKCQSSKECKDIVLPISNCSQYQFNNRPCLQNPNQTQCQEFNCSFLNKQDCLTYPQYCYFEEEACKTNQCSNFDQQNCIENNCDWNLQDKVCEEQIECFQIKNEKTCNRKQFQNNHCLWVIQNETCVELNDPTNALCEEISNSCECTKKSDYCYYDRYNKKCKSKNCQQYLNQKDCPTNFCTYINGTCLTKCEYLYKKQDCINQNMNCQWNDNLKNCQIMKEPEKQDSNLPEVGTTQIITEINALIIIISSSLLAMI